MNSKYLTASAYKKEHAEYFLTFNERQTKQFSSKKNQGREPKREFDERILPLRSLPLNRPRRVPPAPPFVVLCYL